MERNIGPVLPGGHILCYRLDSFVGLNKLDTDLSEGCKSDHTKVNVGKLPDLHPQPDSQPKIMVGIYQPISTGY